MTIATRIPVVLLCAIFLVPAHGWACDVCAVYTATELREARVGLRLGVAEQLTNFTTLQDGGREIPNPARERLTSSITQLIAGYNVTPRFGLQLTLPIISRTYRRLEEGGVVHGDETGIGDMSIVGNWLALSRVSEQSVLRISLLGGLKLPSGDSGRLAEESEEGHHHASATRRGPSISPRHTGGDPPGGGDSPADAEPVSGIHGHDLALGSGSVDGIVGGQIFFSWQRLFVSAWGQYAVRTEGDFDYTYANDLTWSGGPGVLALLTHHYTLGVQALLTGETKGKDDLDGVPADDTGITALYVGPGFTFTWGTSLGAEIAADLPVVQNNTSVQIVADYRLRGGLTWRF
jgi:hypothetical protein